MSFLENYSNANTVENGLTTYDMQDLIAPKLLELLFKHRIGVLPYETDPAIEKDPNFYRTLNITAKIDDIDKARYDLIHNATLKMSSREGSPDRVQFIKQQTNVNFGFDQKKESVATVGSLDVNRLLASEHTETDSEFEEEKM